MSVALYPQLRHASTQGVPQAQRLTYWERYNAEELVGLRCSALEPTQFCASQDNLQLPHLRLARIAGNAHMVERNQSLIRTQPRQSVFVCLTRGQGAFFYQHEQCHLLQPGELMIYRTDQPYLFGFSGGMQQWLWELSEQHFADSLLSALPAGLHLGVETPAQRLLVRTLEQRSSRFLGRLAQSAATYESEVLDLLRGLLAERQGQHRASALSTSYLLMAKQYLREHLADPSLSTEQVAAAVGISSRHLGRLFAQQASTPGRYLQGQRLEQARLLLESALGRRLDIAEIAYRHGFANPAHFARSYKQRYGLTPSQAREAAGLGSAARSPGPG